MYSKPSNSLVRLLLLVTCILQALGLELHIKQDTHVSGIYVWTSVAVYAEDVDTSSFLAQELYGLARVAYTEMRADQRERGLGERRRPNVMSALAIGNLVYFASSLKGSHFIMDPSRSDTVIAKKLRACQAGLQVDREKQLGGAQVSIHKNKAQCGEILALHLQETDAHPGKPDLTTSSKKIVAYGGSQIEVAVPMACCGDTQPGHAVDLTSWGCKQFMQFQNVGIFPAIDKDTLVLPPIEPVSFRRVPLC